MKKFFYGTPFFPNPPQLLVTLTEEIVGRIIFFGLVLLIPFSAKLVTKNASVFTPVCLLLDPSS